MKAAPFDYVRADSVTDACRRLAVLAGEGKLIAGGQSLVPMMAMRLARPSVLIDLDGVRELDGITRREDTLVIMSMTRQRRIEYDAAVIEHTPLLARGLPHVGHSQTRNRGTIGGSLAHADPAGEIPLIAVTLGATLTLQSTRGRRDVDADDFFRGPMTTALADDECLTAITLPVWNDRADATRHGPAAREQ